MAPPDLEATLKRRKWFALGCLMKKVKTFHLLAVVGMAVCASNPLRAEPLLGDAPKAPADVSGLPGRGFRALNVTGGFTVSQKLAQFASDKSAPHCGIRVHPQFMTASSASTAELRINEGMKNPCDHASSHG
jgi:hypothetical protein